MSKTDTPTDQVDLPAEVQKELLSSRRRCLLLTTLAEVGDVAVVDLAAQLGGGGTDSETAAAGEAAHEQIRWEIYDRHLPKLTATGVVEYDSQLGKLRLAEPAIVPAARRALGE